MKAIINLVTVKAVTIMKIIISTTPGRLLKNFILECGGKRSATPLWISALKPPKDPKRRRRFALPAHSTLRSLRTLKGFFSSLPGPL